MKRPETYVFFLVLFLFSIVGVDFIFQGVEIGLMKKNAPLVIAKAMGAITGIFMILVSMIMGVPILRDFQYDMASLLFVNPITKRDYLIGRFLGSFLVLLFIFSGLLLGMILGSQMPWHKEEEMLAFNLLSYVRSYLVIVVPILFFGASLFFVTGMLTKKLLVVYTQGIVLFVVFMLTKAITNEVAKAILDPFSLTTLTKISDNWSIADRNINEMTYTGLLLYNKLFWCFLGIIILTIGYFKFSFHSRSKPAKSKTGVSSNMTKNGLQTKVTIPKVKIQSNFKVQCIQLVALSIFFLKSLLKETSFWAIAICGVIIILINSVNLGTIYNVDSIPATYFIVEELQEMSLYFFLIILLFYAGELVHKEKTQKINLIFDATAIPDITPLLSKFIALIMIYSILMCCLIITGILFQIANGYYQFDLFVYFSGFFLEVLPFLIVYTVMAFFFQTLSNSKFIGILLTLLFFIITVGLGLLGFDHNLYSFGGKTLGIYSEMNGYGHLLVPYLLVKSYWFTFGCIVLIVSSLLYARGTEIRLYNRIRYMKYRLTRPILRAVVGFFLLFIGLGVYIFFNTNVLNDYFTDEEQVAYRANYEKTLKQFEYEKQPKITAVHLNIELYPNSRSYVAEGRYTIKNTTEVSIKNIHVQKVIASHVTLDSVIFDNGARELQEHKAFDYSIYELSKVLEPGDSITMHFKQSYVPLGFENGNEQSRVLHNGTFLNNQEFPTLGYNRKYELRNPDDREKFQLDIRPNKMQRNDANEIINGQSGGDSDGIRFDIVIGTTSNQTALAPGSLVKKWTHNKRRYFHYKMKESMINFYAIISAEYEVKKDWWKSTLDINSNPVSLEVYHHKKHTYNLDRMMTSMKASLSYFGKNFGPYQYSQLRIMEFPRYQQFAQSFPNTIPFSESIGFVLDIDDTTDVDMVFYVTAHEVAHQWFGMQVEAANVKGRHLILETLSQYAAMMVLKERYSETMVTQFLTHQQEVYQRERKKSKSPEPPLVLVENQDYVYYSKGALAMYSLQKEIGEHKVNIALKRFIQDWNTHNGILKSQTNRYATTKDLVEYLKSVTPDSSQWLIKDLFENNESSTLIDLLLKDS